MIYGSAMHQLPFGLSLVVTLLQAHGERLLIRGNSVHFALQFKQWPYSRASVFLELP